MEVRHKPSNNALRFIARLHSESGLCATTQRSKGCGKVSEKKSHYYERMELMLLMKSNFYLCSVDGHIAFPGIVMPTYVEV